MSTDDSVRTASVYALARMADCCTPDSEESAGAGFLMRVRDAVVESFDAGDWDEDSAAAIADGAPDVYTARVWAQFVDLGAYMELSYVRDEGLLTEIPQGDTDDVAGICLYVIAGRLAVAVAEALAEETDTDAANDTDES